MRRLRQAALFTALLFVGTAMSVLAQGTGAIAGRVSATSGGLPVGDAHVLAIVGGRTAGRVNTSADGTFRMPGLAAGTYTVIVTNIGYVARRTEGVTVGEGQTATINVLLAESAASLTQVVVTAGRKAERALDAPAQISVVTTEEITTRPSITVTDHIKSSPGINVSTGGIAQANIVARGFNNAFSGAMLMLQDYRFAGVPSLRVNVPFLFTGANEDIERIELLLGPASALYGPNSGNGVLHVLTKSPFDSKGTTVTFDGGERQIFRASVRHAGTVNDKIGYKVSAETFTGRDWDYVDPGEPVKFDTAQRVPVDRRGAPSFRDYGVRRQTFEGRVDLRPMRDLTLISTVGYTNIGSGLELTGANGTSQVKNWSYTSFQERINYKRFFGQIFMNNSDAGNSSAQDSRSTYLLRSGQPIVDKSRVIAVQATQGFNMGKNQQFTVGGDYIFTNPRTGNTINGANEDRDDVTEIGGYVQSETKFSERLQFIGALRLDSHSAIDELMISPRAALIFRPTADQNFRVAYNRAFSTPANFSFFLDLIQTPNIGGSGFDLKAEGNPPKTGWDFNRGCAAAVNGGLCMRSPFTGGQAFVNSSAASALPGFFAAKQSALNASLTPQMTAAFAAFGPATAAALGSAVASAITGSMIASTPTDAQLASRIAMLSTSFNTIAPTSVTPIAPLKASYNQTFEVGWKGIAMKRMRFDASVWYQNRADVGTSASLSTPSVFVGDTAQARSFVAATIRPAIAATITPTFIGAAAAGAFGPGCTGANATPCGTAQANGTAAAISAGVSASFYSPSPVTGRPGALAGAPLGTVTFNSPSVTDGSLLATYQLVGTNSIDVYGFDLGVEYELNDRWAVLGTASGMNQNLWENIPGGNGLGFASNSPRLNGTATIRYRDEREGFNAEVRTRVASGYQVNSGVYANGFGFAIPSGNPGYVPGAVTGPGQSGPGTYNYESVPRMGLLDVSASWRLPWEGQNMTVSLSATNLLNQQYRTFAGAPIIGRMIMTRLQLVY